MEKLLKLSLGLKSLVDQGQWPIKNTMRHQYGHDIETMNREVFQSIGQNLTAVATHPPIMQAALEDLRSQRLMLWVVGTMSRYAQEGRFYNLDCLAEATQTEPSPSNLWSDLETGVATTEIFAELMATNDTPNAWRREVVAQVDRGIRAWTHCLQVAWTQNLFGPEARRLSHTLKLPT